MKKILLIFVLLISSAFAQVSNNDYFRCVLPEVAKTWQGYTGLAVGAGVSGLALLVDKPVQEFMTKKAYLPPVIDAIADSYVDHYWAFAVSALGAAGKGYQTGNYLEPMRYWAVSNVATVAMTYALKYSVGRLRPNGRNHHSYPSGHSSVAFATATMYQMWYGWKAGIPAYAMATLTAFQRLDDNQHWFSDVIMGATIGIIIPYMFYTGEQTVKDNQNLICPPLSVSIPFNFPVGK